MVDPACRSSRPSLSRGLFPFLILTLLVACGQERRVGAKCKVDTECADGQVCADDTQNCVAPACGMRCPTDGCPTECPCALGICSSSSDFCGDGTCNGDETQDNCCQDCGCPAGKNCSGGTQCTTPPTGPRCGDGTCSTGETQAACCRDCGCPSGQNCSGTACVPVTGETCTDDLFEPNDDQNGARSIAAGSYVQLQICPGDADWYKVSLAAGMTLAATAAMDPALGDIDLELHAADGSLLDQSNGASASERVEFTVTTAQQLFIAVFGVQNAKNHYDLSVEVRSGSVERCGNSICGAGETQANCCADCGCATGSSCVNGSCRADQTCADDAREDNDLQSQASPVTAGTYGSLAICPGDDDWYAVNAAAGATATVEIAFNNAAGDLDVRLLDQSGAEVDRSQTGGNTETVTFTTQVAQTLYAQVMGHLGAGNSYSMTVTVQGQTACTDDAFEDNDDQTGAKPLQPGSYPQLHVCSGDDDWFAVQVGANDTVTASIDFVHAQGDLDLYLLDGNGAELARSAGETDGESLTYLSPTAGTVFLVVTGYNGAANAYDLTLGVQGGAACTDDAQEENDTQSAAKRIGAGSFPGLHVCPGDDDWYSVSVGAGATLTAQIAFTHANGDLDMKLYDAAGTELSRSTGSTDAESVAYTSAAAQLLFVRVYGFNGAANAYALTVSVQGGGGGCADDSYEENDARSSARTVGAGSYGSLQACPGDEDWFAVSAGAGQTLTASIDFTASAGNLDLQLVDAQGTVLRTSATSGSPETATYLVSAAQLIYVRVYGGQNAYAMTVGLQGGTPSCQDDGNEQNDTSAAATPIGSGSFPNLQVCANDDDWYAIQLGAGDSLRVETRFTATAGDLDLKLFDAAGTQLGSSTGTTDVETINYTAPAAATVYARVYGYAGAENSYALTVDVQPPAPTCTDDSYEPNDAQSAARPLGAGTYANLQVCANDDDWYAIAVPANGTVTVTLTFTHAQGDLDLRLHDAAGAELRRSESLTDSETVTWTAGSAATVSARVFGYNGAANTYTMQLQVTAPPPACTDDAREQNDTQAAAGAVTAGTFTGLQICAGDDDWYSVALNAGATLTARIDFTHANGDLDLKLHDATGAELLRSTGATDSEQVTYTSAAAATVFVHAYGYNGAQNAYAMTLGISGGTPTCTDDALEDNDARTAARTLAAGNRTGLQICSGDDDWYAVSLNAGATLTATATFTHASGDLDMVLQDGSGAELGRSTGATDTETITYTSATAQIVYLRVYGYQGASNAYALNIAIAGGTPSCVDDGSEENDSQSAAKAAAAGTLSNLKICANDEDWFAVTVGANATLKVTINFTHANGDLDLRLVNGSGTELSRSEGTTDSEQVTYTTPTGAAGTLYPVIFGYGGAANAYSMTVEITGGTQCADDAFEPNDAQSAARTLASGTYASLQICSNDDDWYAIAVGQGATLTATANFTHANGDLDLQLLSAAGVELARSTTTTNQEQITYAPPGAGETVYLRVYGYNGAANAYSLAVTVSGGTPTCTDDLYEENDTQAAARTLGAGTSSSLNHCANDDDWYAFSVAAGSTLTVRIDFTNASGNLDLALLNAGGTQLAASASTTAGTEQVSTTVSSAQTLSARVYGAQNAYSMTVTIAGPTCSDDGLEQNDTQSAARSMGVGTTNGLQICASDDDWYSIALTAGQTVTVTINFTNANGDLDLKLHDAAGAQLAASTGATDTETVSWTAAAAGAVYARVYGYSGAQNTYAMTIAVAGGTPQCTDDAQEQNDSLAGAKTLAPGTYGSLQICANDEDWYAVAVGAGQTLTASIGFTHANGDLDFKLHDASGAELARSTGATDSESVSYTSAAAATLYLHAYGYSGAQNNYALVISVTGGTPTCTDDAFEQNDTLAAARVTVAGNYTNLRICSADEDWYAIDVGAAQTLTVISNFTHANGDLDLKLFDGNGTELARSTGATDQEQVTWTATTAARVYAQVYGYNGASNLYTMTVSLAGGSGGTCTDDSREDNDTKNTAWPIGAGTLSSLKVCGTDTDWWSIHITGGTTLTVTINFTNSAGDLDLRLYNAGGSLLKSSTGVTDTETVTHTVTTTQALYIHVSGYNNASNTYSMTVSASGGSVCVDDLGEENDTQTLSTELLPGTQSGLKICSGDVDYWAVQLFTNETLTATASFTNSAGDLDLELYDENGTLVDESAGTTNTETVGATALATTYVYLRVFGYAGAQNSYSLNIAVQ